MADHEFPEEGQPARHWTLDKRVPVALIASILLQTAGFGIWIGSINSRVASLEEYRIADVAASKAATDAANDRQGRIIRLETLAQTTADTLAEMKRTLVEMNRKLDQGR